MDRLLSMRIFRTVVEEGAFARAARRLRLSNAAVSKHVAALEEALGTRLLHRTTRRLALTPDGRAYLERAAALLDELDALEHAMREGAEAPRGTLRVAAPLSFGLARLAPALPRFLDAHPEVRVDLALTDRFVDVVEEGVDLAVRVARALPDSSLIARRLAAAPRVLVAAPAYLEAHGTPEAPAELEAHACLRYTGMRDFDRWRFQGPAGDAVEVEVDGPLDADNSLALRPALLAGLGLTLTPRFVVAPDLEAGLLVPVLEDWEAPPATVFGVYPARRHRSAKLRAFLGFAERALAEPA
ncbi:MAG: LysR family transcriptional regulator [Sandaracinus sp.]|nr:LysR family transcriptional regulator [Sandaracinus sp.]